MKDQKEMTDQEVRAMVDRFADRVAEYAIRELPRAALESFLRITRDQWATVQAGSTAPHLRPDAQATSLTGLFDRALAEAVRFEVMRADGCDRAARKLVS